MTALHLEKITKVYSKGGSEVRALDGIDLDIEAGEFLTVVGPSGSGKTTFLNILIPVLTVRENVELPLLIERKLGAREVRRRAEEMIAAVGLAGKENRYP